MLKPPNGGGDSSDGVLGPPLTDRAREKLLPVVASAAVLGDESAAAGTKTLSSKKEKKTQAISILIFRQLT